MGSKLEDYVGNKLNFYFGHMKIHRNTRPVWLQNEEGNRLELDFYIPLLSVAVEVQGEQHYQFVDFFHKGQSRFEKRKRDDETKRRVCKARGIELVEISNRSQVRNLINRLDAYTKPESKLPSIFDVTEAEFGEVVEKNLHEKVAPTSKQVTRALNKHARAVAYHRYSIPEVAEESYRKLMELCERLGMTEADAKQLIEKQPTKAHPYCDNCGSKIRGEHCRNKNCSESPLFNSLLAAIREN